MISKAHSNIDSGSFTRESSSASSSFHDLHTDTEDIQNSKSNVSAEHQDVYETNDSVDHQNGPASSPQKLIESITKPTNLFQKNSNVFPYLNTTLHQTLHQSMQELYEMVTSSLNPDQDSDNRQHFPRTSDSSEIHPSETHEEIEESHIKFLQDFASNSHKVLQRHLESRIESSCEKAALEGRIESYSCKGSNWELKIKDLHEDSSLMERVISEKELKRKNSREKQLRKISLEGKSIKVYTRSVSILPLKRKRTS